MFRLYGPDNNLIIKDSNELKIIDKLGNSIGIYDDINYIIIESQPNGDHITNVILNYNDYLGYKHSVYERCKEELKGYRECKFEEGYIKKYVRKNIY